tara:strand:- start:281 stop:433 length:153 start_codon:yes stop_codon:yes gene_type:complete
VLTGIQVNVWGYFLLGERTLVRYFKKSIVNMKAETVLLIAKKAVNILRTV